jgi:hypothetical protein
MLMIRWNRIVSVLLEPNDREEPDPYSFSHIANISSRVTETGEKHQARCNKRRHDFRLDFGLEKKIDVRAERGRQGET